MARNSNVPVAVLAGLAVTAVVTYFVWSGRRLRPRAKKVTVTALYIYPLKHDRRWMMVNHKGEFMSQRKYPSMAHIEAAPTDDGASVTLSAPGKRSITVNKAGDGRSLVTVDVWGAAVQGIVVPEANEWLQEYFGQSCSLVYMPDDFTRPIEPPFADNETTVVFQDGYPQLLASEEALDLLNSKLETPVDMRRFRPNIVVKGCAPHEEDTWKVIQSGDLVFEGVKLCARCSVPTVNPDKGKYDQRYEPIKTLRTYRSNGSDVFFGMNMINRTTQGTLRVGDEFTILEWHTDAKALTAWPQ